MGCFNVACSVSNLSINAGDPIIFIPLMPNNQYVNYGVGHQVGTQKYLIYPNCYFNPIGFPIKGTYNDYGSLENIVEDANTKAIEKAFGVDIETFVDSVGSGRSYASQFFPAIDKFVFDKVAITEYGFGLDHKFIKKMGFIGNKKKGYTFRDYPYTVFLTDKKIKLGKDIHEREDYGYIIKDKDGKIVKEHTPYFQNREYFLVAFKELTGYYLGVPDEDQDRIKGLTNMSGMFVHGDIFDALIKSAPDDNYFKSGIGQNLAYDDPRPYSVEKLGFVLEEDLKNSHGEFKYYHPDNPEITIVVSKQYYCKFYGPRKKQHDVVMSCYDLAFKMIEHGVCLNIPLIEEETTAGRKFEELRNALLFYHENKEEKKEKRSKLIKEHPDLASIFILDRHPLEGYGSLLDRTLFKDWLAFKDIYEESILDGSLKPHWEAWSAFYPSMYSCNVFYFPAMNGEQHGNDGESKNMYETALNIVNKRIERRIEEDEEWEEQQAALA
jgi:hypothetical protein